MSTCQGCGASLRSYERSCRQCGQAVPKPCCQHCGEELASAYAYSCRACGEKVQKDTTEQSPGRSEQYPSVPSTSTSSSTPRPNLSSSVSQQRPDFVNPSVLCKVLYVAPESSKRELRSLFYRVHRANRGDVIWVSADTALEDVQKHLQRQARRTSAVCLIGTDDHIPHIRWQNPVTQGMASTEEVETDNPYGMFSNPTEAERMTGHLINDIPVTRIPSVDPDLIGRLLSVHDDLPSDWDNGVAVSAAVWEGPSRYTVEQYTTEHKVEFLLSPPNKESSVHAILQQRKPSRLMFNVHGHNIMADWYGDGDGDNPVALEASGAEVAHNGVVLAEACYGAMVSDHAKSIALTFLEKGASCFVGSTIIAWGAVGTDIRKGSSADAVAEYFYDFLDQGLPIGEALRATKLRILDEAQDENGVINPMIHNTLASFVVYGAPFAKVSAPRRYSNATKSLEPSTSYASLVKSYRGLPNSGESVLNKYRARLQARLPEDVWKALDVSNSSIDLQTVLDDDTIRALGISSTGVLSKYRSHLAVRQCVVALDAHQQPKMALILDEQNQVLEKMVVR